jgi:hypothetical protein
MPMLHRWGSRVLLLCLVLFSFSRPVSAQALDNLAACREFGFSTEEDFLAGVPIKDGNQLISDGDFLSTNGEVCARNWELLQRWEIRPDLGLDAVDLVDLEQQLVAFSTEINDPRGRFTAGDLLATNGAIIPNAALLTRFQVGRDLGLDGLHFIGDPKNIALFLEVAAATDPAEWLNGKLLPAWLERYEIDIWFSTEGQERRAAAVPIYDGDILSARDGTVVLAQDQLMLASVPAGIPNRGVDFGVDGIAGSRHPDRSRIRFSSEILYRKEPAFDDGDVLRTSAGVETIHDNLIAAFQPRAKFLGIDALHMLVQEDSFGGNGGDQPVGADSNIYLPLVQTQTQPGGGQ